MPGARPARWPRGCSGIIGATSPGARRWTIFPWRSRGARKPFVHAVGAPCRSAMAFQLTPVSAPSRDYVPATFRERGVAVPFTTPLLTGARVRRAEQGGTELLMLNPAGAPGVYILPSTGLGTLCRPSVHDTRLNQRISTLPTITPASVRDAAREVAASGLAG